MARLLTCGFEGGSWSLEGPFTLLGTAPTVQSTTVRTGGWAAACNAGSGQSSFRYTVNTTAGKRHYAREYIRIPSAPSAAVTVLGAEHSTSGAFAEVRLNTDRTLSLRGPGGVAIGSPSAALAVDTQYRVELYWRWNTAGADGEIELRLDGNTVASTATATLANAPDRLVFGPQSTTGNTIYVDDVAYNDDAGASQNSWPGSGRIYHLKPVADSSRGTNWFDNAGATTDLWQAVDNAPPVGVPPTGPTFQSFTAHAGNPTTSATVTLPTTAADDILILVAVNAGSTTALTTSGTYSGGAWSSVGAGAGTAQWGGVWWSRATGNHSGQTVIVGTATDSCSAAVMRVSGCLTGASPIDTNTTNVNLAANGLTAAAFNTTVADTLVVLAAAADDNIAYSGQTAGGVAMAERGEAASTGGADSSVMLATIPQASIGTTGAFAGTHASALSKRLVAFALKPVPATAKAQIKNVGSGTTETYAAGLQSYDEASVDAGTIKYIEAFASIAGTTTNQTLATLEIVSNPAVAEDGAAGSNLQIAGTWPTNWSVQPSDIRRCQTHNPTVTRATRPVLRVKKTDPDGLLVSMMALLVEVEPTAGPITDSGTVTTTGVHAGADAVADTGTQSTSGTHTGAEAVADSGVSVSAAVHSGAEVLAETSGITSVVVPDGTGYPDPISDAGSSTSVAVLTGEEVLVDSQNQTSIATHAGAEALADVGGLTSVATHTGTETLVSDIVESGTVMSVASPVGAEALADVQGITSTADTTGAEALAETGVVATTTTHAGAVTSVDSGALATVAALSGAEALAEISGITSVATSTGADSLAEAQVVTSVAITAGVDALAEIGGITAVAVHTGDETLISPIVEAGTITSVAAVSGVEVLTESGGATSATSVSSVEAVAETAEITSTAILVAREINLDEGTAISLAELAGVEALVDIGGLASVAVYEAVETSQDAGALTSIAVLTGDQQIVDSPVDSGTVTTVAVLTGSEQIVSPDDIIATGTITSSAQLVAQEIIVDRGDLSTAAQSAGVEAVAETAILSTSSVLSALEAKAEEANVTSAATLAVAAALAEAGGAISTAGAASLEAIADRGDISAQGQFVGLESVQELGAITSIADLSGTGAAEGGPQAGDVISITTHQGIEVLVDAGLVAAVAGLTRTEALAELGALVSAALLDGTEETITDLEAEGLVQTITVLAYVASLDPPAWDTDAEQGRASQDTKGGFAREGEAVLNVGVDTRLVDTDRRGSVR